MSGVAVPVFFIISGLLLGRHINEDGWYRRAVISRFKSLVIPFFALNLFWFPVKYTLHYIGVRYFGADGSDSIMDFTFYNFIYGVGIIPWGGNVVVGLWYVRALFYIVLLSPFLAWFIRKGKIVSGFFILSLLGLWCLQSRIHTTNAALAGAMRYAFCLRGPLFFSIGMACAWYAPSRLPKFSAMLFVPLAIGSLAFAKGQIFSDPSISTLTTFISTTLLAFALWSITPSCKWPQYLTGNSFSIFVLHGMILYLLPLGMKAFGIWEKTLSQIGFLPIFALTVIIAILIAETTKKYLPCLAKVFFGGR